ncbi:periplasmic nitrate reductase subunit NapB [Luteimonas cucumeris]|uniref:Periplasmic nitrate reductase, electron transfer subunit n=1 Tax=Luteimonas cucumeris TaxID=985012 RepID=A0A562L282_9GAMM|nr:nitrate reductase cytochrome c-type subunit [Luteimonas cucumeris]TWI01745.1 periplasmic nitrate reductase subunit NapB [Luteimonas cucumeris]
MRAVRFLLLTGLVATLPWIGACDRGSERAHQPPPSQPVSARGNPARDIDPLRRHVPIMEEVSPLPMARVENFDVRRGRAYPMQPPTIPHTTDGYQVTLHTNRCMLCHARANAPQFQAPEVSVTHYMDRDNQFLATISTRRYFCLQCHVTQTDAQPLVANTFKDIDSVLAEQRARRELPQ